MNLSKRLCLLSSILGVLSFSHLQAITVNGQELKKVESDQVLFYENENGHHIALTIQDGAIEIGQGNIEEIKKLVKQAHDQLLSGARGPLVAHTSNKIYISRGIMEKIVSNEYVSGDEGIALQAGSVSTINSILKAKDIQVSCGEFKADICFMDADTLTLYSAGWPYSFFQYIRFTFGKDYSGPRLVRGTLDFRHNKTEDGVFLVVGASKVEIAFSKKAFK